MDKYKVILKIEQTKRLASEKKYKEAYDEMKFLNLAKMKNYDDLIIFADIFVRNKKYVEAKELLERLHTKTVTRRLLTQLIFVSAKTKNFVDAEKYYQEYVRIAPKDINKYILRYRIDKEKGLSKDILIKTLEELKEYDYVEEWAYELAKLYHKAGRSKECIRECSNIELWFGDGIIVEKAKLLREHHINALTDVPLGQLSNEVMDFTATGKLIDLLGIVPEQKSEEDAFANTTEFERDNDKVDEDNRRFMPQYNEESFYAGAEGGSMKEISADIADDTDNQMEAMDATKPLSEEQVDAMLGQILEDKKPVKQENDEELKKVTQNPQEKKTKKHSSFVEAFRNMMAIRDYDEEYKELEEDSEEDEAYEGISEDTVDQPQVELEEFNQEDETEDVAEESDDEIEQETVSEDPEEEIKLTDADFDPELLELEKIISESKSKKEIEAEAKNVARDIRKDLASQISSYVEEEEKVKSEFKEDMEQLEAMATKRIVSVDDILAQLDENKAEQEYVEAEAEAQLIESEVKGNAEDEVETEFKEETDSQLIEEPEAEAEPEEVDAEPVEEDRPQPEVDEQTQRENIDKVLAMTSVHESPVQVQETDNIKPAKISVEKDVFRNFAENEYLKSTLNNAFVKVRDNARCANFIISGEKKTGKSTLAKMIVKQLKSMGAVATGKVARIDATRFNNVDLELKQDSLMDCCLIINNAHEISPYAITGLISMLIRFNGRTIVILETCQPAGVILEKTSEVGDYFSNVIEMPKYTTDDLIALGESYADMSEYRINDSGAFALRSILDERLDSMSQTAAVEYVIDILDNAMISAQNRNRNKLKEILTLKTTDFEGFNEIDMQDIMPL